MFQTPRGRLGVWRFETKFQLPFEYLISTVTTVSSDFIMLCHIYITKLIENRKLLVFCIVHKLGFTRVLMCCLPYWLFVRVNQMWSDTLHSN